MDSEEQNNYPVPTREAMEQNPNMFPQQHNMFNPAFQQLPDVPLVTQPSMVEHLLSDDEVPEEIKKKFWFVFHKDNVLGFLDEKRKQDRLLAFDIAKIDSLACTSYYDYTFEQEREFNILRNILEGKLDRALGVNVANIKNERIMLQSQFSEQRSISELKNDQSNIREGFFKRLLGRR